MEITTLDSLLRRETLVDKYESFIWTERWQGAGDFELVMKANSDNRSLFSPGTWLTIPDSDRVMEVETIEDQLSSDGVTTLTIKGRSIEATIMENRVAMKPWRSTPPAEDRWEFTTNAWTVALRLWAKICYQGYFNAADIVPNQVPESGSFTWQELGTLPLPNGTEYVTYSEPAKTLFAAIDDWCKKYDMGYKIYRNEATQLIRFVAYRGTNRTTAQTTLRPVIFSPSLETIQNVTTLKSIVGSKNVAYVFSPAGRAVVFGLNVDPEVDGFERRILLVNASEITGKKQVPEGETGEPPLMTAAELNAALVQKGTEELTKHMSFYGVDGELDPYGSYIYNKDYQLGDLVELRNVDGATQSMRVTEQIFVSDAEGERSFPTLSINSFIYPGAWNSMGTRTWESMDLTEYWSNAV